MEIRVTTHSDITAIDALLARSYPILLKPDYKASVLVRALPLITRVQPGLVVSGSYFGLFEADQLLAAGGWTRAAPGAGGVGQKGQGHIRHVVTDHMWIRRGLGRRLMTHIIDHARADGILEMACQATLTAVPFYRSCGFQALGQITLPLRPGIDFPAMAMRMAL